MDNLRLLEFADWLQDQGYLAQDMEDYPTAQIVMAFELYESEELGVEDEEDSDDLLDDEEEVENFR